MAKTDSNGLGEPLHDPPQGDTKVDIVFVHGLHGDRIKTWTSEPTRKNPSVFWPKDLLPIRCTTARILSFGYNASAAHFYPLFGPGKVPPTTTIDDHSTALLDSLIGLRTRTETNDRPIIFVAHSLGGLVCANAISKQHGTETAEKALVGKVRGMIFLGTPFAGSEKASWALIGTQFLSLFSSTNEEKIGDLEKRSKMLIDINNNFLQVIKERDRIGPWIEVACYFEEIPTKAAGFSIGFIVDRASATLPGIVPLSIQEDHSDMCKFEDEYRSGFISISNKLSQWIQALDKKAEDHGGKQGGITIGPTSLGAISNNHGVVSAVITSTATDGNRIVGSQKITIIGDSAKDIADKLVRLEDGHSSSGNDN
ncbi:hypothetical protein GQ53DRAFT_806100 [Thozetella sp. PMI_491]|nr:hypothetical protein GQ53DRAFT_806100 [Thozetella sp. PMI_491]